MWKADELSRVKLVMAMMAWIGAGMEMVVEKVAGQSVEGSEEAGALNECEVNTLMIADHTDI